MISDKYNTILPVIEEYKFLKEKQETINLIQELTHVKSRQYLTLDELIKISKWKTPRQRKNILSNPAAFVKNISRLAFKENDEKIKIRYFNCFSGVSFPTASAILTIVDPANYGVIDIRAWQTLIHFGVVNKNKNGIKFSYNEWEEYLFIIRELANYLNINARDIDLRLYKIHQDRIQKGRLYK